ncbi:MAG: type IX secretion system outer membrane channel protein PorV [Cyclobacteriaceae bacterium]
MAKSFRLLFSAILVFLSYTAFSQSSAIISGQDTTRRPITTAVPFLTFSPDSRSSAMGETGVATSPDANSVHWNNAKLAFIEDEMGFSVSYVPWLGNIVDDMSVSYLTGFKKIDRVQTVGMSLRYFDLGEIQLTNDQGFAIGLENPRELAVDGTYSRKLTENMGIGVTGRYIWSNLSGSISNNSDGKPGSSVAVDLGWYYRKDLLLSGRNSNLALGASITNIGAKLTYSSESNEDFIPVNLRIGSAFTTNLDPYNSLTFAVDFNKLLVPTPPIYEVDENGNFVTDPNTGDNVIRRGKDPDRPLLSGMFGSFSDAPDGFSEEMQEIQIAFGTEYWYRDVFAARAGYFYENANKGARQFITVGMGFRYQVFGLDFSYLVPTEQNHPLAETLRFTLMFNFNTEDDPIPPTQ